MARKVQGKSKGKVKVFGLLAAARRVLLSSASYAGYVGYVPRSVYYDEGRSDLTARTAIKYVDGMKVIVDLETGAAV